MQAISGAEKGERAALLLSPSCSYPIGTGDSSRHSIGSLFTVFLTAPLQAFCLLLGVSGSDVEMVCNEQIFYFSCLFVLLFYLVLLTGGKFSGHL